MPAAPWKSGASAQRRDFKIDCGLPPRDGWQRACGSRSPRPLGPSPGGVHPVAGRSWALAGGYAARPGSSPRCGYDVRRAVAVAQLVEPRVVVPVVAGSSPVRHP